MMSIIFFVLWMGHTPGKSPDAFIVIKEMDIKLTGQTNIGDFECTFTSTQANDTLYLTRFKDCPYSFEIPVKSFKCDNLILNYDFRKTLQTDQYPHIMVEVLSLYQTGHDRFSGSVSFCLAGKTKILEAISFCKDIANGQQRLTADFHLNGSDFGIKPRQKLGGMITTRDALEITVSMRIQDV